MAGSLINRFKQTLSGFSLGGGGEGGGGKLARYFKHLAKADSALPGAVSRYVKDGENSSVLSTLQQHSAQNAWNQRARSWPPRDEEALFSDLSKWRIDQMQRFGQALAALEPINYDWGHFGTKKSPDWLRHVVTIWLGNDRKNQPVETLTALAELGGDQAALTLDILFCRDAATWKGNASSARFSGVSDWLMEYDDAVEAAAPGLTADVRAELASGLGRFSLQNQYAALLVDMAIGSSKKVRANARQALTGCNPAVLTKALDERYAKAAPGAKVELIETAVAALRSNAAELLARWKVEESNPKVLSALERLASAAPAAPVQGNSIAEGPPDGPDGYLAVDGSRVDVPPLPRLPESGAFPADVLKILEPAMAEFNAMLAKGKAEGRREQWHWSRQFSPKDSSDLRRLAALAGGNHTLPPHPPSTPVDWLRFHQFKHPAVAEFFADPRLNLRHIARFAAAMSNMHFYGLFSDWSGPIGAEVQRRLAAGADLRNFMALWIEAGGQDVVTGKLTERYWWGGFPEFDVPVWPLLWQHMADLDQALGLVPQSANEERRLLPGLQLLELFPKLPERYRARLLHLAGDSSARIRDLARALLQGTPGLAGSIAVQLQDGRQDTRAMAADWLAMRGEKDQAGAIRAALKKEKSDIARAAMITALDRLGEDVSEYFDHATLVKEAQAGLAKPRPKGIDWFRLDSLPALKWADGSAVDPLLPQWWVVLAVKLKQPGGNALMNLWLDRLAPGEAHKLGWAVLTAWIDEDTRCPTDEEANAYAAAHVDATLAQNISWAKRYPQSADYWPTDRTVVFARLKAAKAGTYLGSAIDAKGMLALAARVSGTDAAQRIRPFLKDHGARVAQAKALIEVLAAIGSAGALQLLLSAANRSKQRSVQAHAAALIEDIAERNGWSPAQLADRTIPTGGFEADGTQDLDLGEGRIYRLQFDAQDAVIILNPDGREVKALPGARVDEERPLVDTAKKQLSTARKEVKQVLTAQTERLQEAMFLQRAWDRGEWESFIAGHPVVGRIAARLVWQGLDNQGAPAGCFRPLGDGSMSDAEDGDVDLAHFAQVRLAHSSVLEAGEVAAWRKHLADYGVDQPFDQLGRDLPVLAKGQEKSRTITDREGWMIENFKLRGAATKLGYQRGPAQDGGWFMTYEKTYRDAGLVAEIEFTGSPLPEENREVALVSLSFRKLRQGGHGSQADLGEVPSVLLAETWRDLHDIAEKGTGHDPDWKKKAY